MFRNKACLHYMQQNKLQCACNLRKEQNCAYLLSCQKLDEKIDSYFSKLLQAAAG